MSDLNFLPKEQIDSRRAEGMSGKFKFFAALFGFVCIAIGALGTVYVFYRQNQVSTLEKQAETLKAQIAAQESTEQVLVLVRDRLTKIKELQSKNSNNAVLLADANVLQTFPTETELKQLAISPSGSSFSVIVKNSDQLKDVLEKMKTKEFQTGSIDSLSFNNELGYQIKFKIQ